MNKMIMMFNLLMGQPQGQGGGSIWDFVVIIGMVFFIMWFIVIRPQKKQEEKRRDMLKSVKKGDEVMTRDGIFGKVVAVKEKESKIVIKVDESTNTKITFLIDAISNVTEGKEEKENT